MRSVAILPFEIFLQILSYVPNSRSLLCSLAVQYRHLAFLCHPLIMSQDIYLDRRTAAGERRFECILRCLGEKEELVGRIEKLGRLGR